MTEETRNGKRNNGEVPKGKKHTPPAGMSDSWLLDLVDDPETDRMLSELVVQETVEKLGMEREEAERAFLPVPREPEIEVEDLYRMMSDIMTGKTKPHIETRAGWEAWRALERDIEEIKRRGGVVDFPAI